MANVTNNRISTYFTEQDVAELAAAREAYLKVLRAKTVALTKEELDSLNSMAVDNFVFVKDAQLSSDAEGVAMLAPAIAAMVPEMGKDVAVFDQTDVELLILYDVITRLEHTKRLAAHEAYTVATKLYEQYKMLAEAGVPGAAARYNALKSRFKNNGAGRRKDEPTID